MFILQSKTPKMSLWVVTQVDDVHGVVDRPTVVLGIYRTFASATAEMKRAVAELEEGDWEVVTDKVEFDPELEGFYYGMKFNEIVRTVLADGGHICVVQVAPVKAEH